MYNQLPKGSGVVADEDKNHSMLPSPKGSRVRVAVLLSGREQFSPYFGGALARWTYEVYNRLQDRIDATVIGYPTASADLYSLPHLTSSVWRVCNAISRVRFVRRYEDDVWLRALFARLRSYDVVHIHNRPQWVRMLRSLGYDGKLILHLQNDHLGHWTASMLEVLAPQVDVVVTCSQYLRGTFAPRSSSLSAKSKVVFNGVNTTLFYPKEEVREPKTIFFVGRFHPEKGVLQLVRAYERVLQTHPDAKLIIGGTTGFGKHVATPYVREVESVAKSLLGGSVQFTGYLDHDRDLPGWFQRATVFAAPSIFQEPFGLVNAEAMACATPVVGSNRGGIPEAVGDTGVLVDPENVDAFADALSRLLADSKGAAELGRSAYWRSRELFDWQVIAEEWGSTLEMLSRVSE